MKSIGVFDAKTHLSELVARVSAGESFRITKHGRPVARLVPDDDASTRRVAAAVERLGRFRGMLGGLDAEQIHADRRRGHRF